MNTRCFLLTIVLIFSTTTFLIALFLHYSTNVKINSNLHLDNSFESHRKWQLKNRRFLDEKVPMKSLYELHQSLGLKIEDNLKIEENDVVKNSVDNAYALSCSTFDRQCWNITKCVREFLVHIYPAEAYAQNAQTDEAYEKILSAIRSSQFYTADPSKACAFILAYSTLDRDLRSDNFDRFLADNLRKIDPNLWRNGSNHIIFNLYHGTYPNYNFDDLQQINPGFSILARASTMQSRYRRHFDVALPLFHKQLPLKLHPAEFGSLQKYNASNEFANAKYLLTFKGKRYVYGQGSETRNSLYHLHQLPSKSTVLVTTCKHGSDWLEFQDDRCKEDNEVYEKGRRLGSFRFLESLKLGCIPVILSDDWLTPFSELIQWEQIVFRLEEKRLFEVVDLLRNVPNETAIEMKRKCRQVYLRYFSSVHTIVDTVFEIVRRRVEKAVQKIRGHSAANFLRQTPSDCYSGDLATFQFERSAAKDPHFAAVLDFCRFKFDETEKGSKENVKILRWQLNELRKCEYCVQVFVLVDDREILDQKQFLKGEFSQLNLKFCNVNVRDGCLTNHLMKQLAPPAIFAVHYSFPLLKRQLNLAMDLWRWQPSKNVIFTQSDDPLPRAMLFHRFYASRSSWTENPVNANRKNPDFSCWLRDVFEAAVLMRQKAIQMPDEVVRLNLDMRLGSISGGCTGAEFVSFPTESGLDSLKPIVQRLAVFEPV